MLNNHRNSSFKSLPRSADAWGSVNTVALEQIQEATHMLTPLTPLTTLTSAPPTPLAYPTPPASATLMTPLASLTPLTPLSSLSELSELADPSQQPTLRPVSVGVQCQTPHAGQHKSGVTLVAGFDPLQPQNIRFEPPRDKEKNVSWTENQRALAQNAINPTSVEELCSLVSYLSTWSIYAYTTTVVPTSLRARTWTVYVQQDPGMFVLSEVYSSKNIGRLSDVKHHR